MKQACSVSDSPAPPGDHNFALYPHLYAVIIYANIRIENQYFIGIMKKPSFYFMSGGIINERT